MSILRIYKIINDTDDLVYIGSTTCAISKRMSEHRRNMRQGEHHAPQNCITRPAELGYGGRENETAQYFSHTLIKHSSLTG